MTSPGNLSLSLSICLLRAVGCRFRTQEKHTPTGVYCNNFVEIVSNTLRCTCRGCLDDSPGDDAGAQRLVLRLALAANDELMQRRQVSVALWIDLVL
jgi:hypothetical protein